MRRVKRWRYYCDYCKKTGGQRPSMERHERGCTANPNRICGLCEHAGIPQPNLTDLTAFIDKYCEGRLSHDLAGSPLDPMIKDLSALAEHCPACILAALRQAKTETYSNFNFKKELDTWWAEENKERMEGACSAY